MKERIYEAIHITTGIIIARGRLEYVKRIVAQAQMHPYQIREVEG